MPLMDRITLYRGAGCRVWVPVSNGLLRSGKVNLFPIIIILAVPNKCSIGNRQLDTLLFASVPARYSAECLIQGCVIMRVDIAY